MGKKETYAEGRLPLLRISRLCPQRTNPAELGRYYSNSPLMYRNILFTGAANLGWNLAVQIITPLVALRLLDLGVGENIQATINTANYWLVSFLVMMFSWMSDHAVSRFGRRKPFLFIAAPFIIITVAMFPLLAEHKMIWLLLAMQGIYLLAMDLKMSTFSLIIIDCVPRRVLARTCSILGIAAGIVGFVSNWNAGRILVLGESAPYLICAAILIISTLSAGAIAEPPIYSPPREPFRPWSTFKVVARDKRFFLLILGVSLVGAYINAADMWLWFWAKENLRLSRGDIFQALAWVGLLNALIAFPMGWVIDRVGGLKVVIVFWGLCLICCLAAIQVATKGQLTLLILAQCLVTPLYQAADIMIYKSCPREEVGSYTATNSCIRNAFRGLLMLVTGWSVYWCDHDYRVAFVIGVIFSTIGLLFLLGYHRAMRPKPLTGGGPAQDSQAVAASS